MPTAEKELLDVLDRKVFGPTIRARQEDYPEDKRRELESVQKTARATRESYHKYGSAAHIKAMFQDDLRSPYGAKQTKMLHDLGLPGFPDVKDEFLAIAEKHRVR